MVLNRKKLINLFVGNVSNAILHKILEEAVEDDIIRKYYDKEFLNSFKIAKQAKIEDFWCPENSKNFLGKYREKINPVEGKLPESSEIKEAIVKRVNNELKIRISKGYKNIDLNLVEPTANNFLLELKVNK